MRFWDSSALLPLVVEEAATGKVMGLLKGDPEITAWWGTGTECISAIVRLEREGALSSEKITAVLKRLDVLRSSWYEVQPLDAIRVTARRLLRVHVLRAADALQLAAAICAAENNPSTLDMVCLDERLAIAARKEGFTILP